MSLRKTHITALVLAILSCAITGSAYRRPPATLTLPVNIEPRLAANFAELRPNHFHGGLDFKTQGRTGLPMLAVAPGYISRVSITEGGYGHAMYVQHPVLGLMTVYGHLSSFGPEIDSLVKQIQTLRGTRYVTVDLIPWLYTVAPGQQIALSGNTGHSMGPHLHFEVRDPIAGVNIDPLIYYAAYIPDTTPPRIHGIALTPADDALLNGGEATVYVTETGTTPAFSAWGTVYPAVRAYDGMDGQTNIYGVKHIILKLDGITVWERHLDTFPTLLTRYISTLVNEKRLENTGEWWEWTRIPLGSPLRYTMVNSNTFDGGITIDQERIYHFTYILSDHYGNTTTRNFTITGKCPY